MSFPAPMRALCAAIKISPRTLLRWRARGCPVTLDQATIEAWMKSAGLAARKRGRRPEAVVLAGNASKKAKPAPTRDGPAPATPGAPPSDMDAAVEAALDLSAEKARKERALASLAELRLAKERGRLLDAKEVEKGRVARVMYAKARLKALPARAAPLCVGKDAGEVFAILDAEVEAVLEDLARE